MVLFPSIFYKWYASSCKMVHLGSGTLRPTFLWLMKWFCLGFNFKTIRFSYITF